MASTTGSSTPQFPSHSEPRVWLLTSGRSPVAIALTRQLLAHGDRVAAGVRSQDFASDGDRDADLQLMLSEAGEGARERLKLIDLDIRSIGQCQAAIAGICDIWDNIDILFCCTSEAVVGTIEELSVSSQTVTLVRDQFETNYFGPVNIIKTILPKFRAQRSGHIMILTGITGHIGTPGLGSYCASSWALEGFCDSLAYEIAPFNIKVTIVQPNMEVNVLTNKITFTPPMPEYAPDTNLAPSVRGILMNTLGVPRPDSPGAARQETNSRGKNPAARGKGTRPPSSTPSHASSDRPTSSNISVYPALPPSATSALVAETIHALTAIGGHENPPARHIVGHEGVASVKEKLKTVSEELEDFIEVSCAVDISKDEGSTPPPTAHDGAQGERDDVETN